MDRSPTSSTPAVLIVEATFRGHKGTYVRWLCEEMLSRGWRVTLGIPEGADAHPGFRQCLAPSLLDQLLVVRAPASAADGEMQVAGPLARELRASMHHWRLFRRLYREASRQQAADIVFMPFLDYCIAAIGLLGSPFSSAPWSGILLRPQVELGANRARQGWKRFLRSGIWPALGRRALRSPTALPAFTIDPRPLQDAVGGAVQLQLLHDPVVLSPAAPGSARDALTIPEKAFVILLYGAVRPRKGLRELVDAAAEVDGVHVICAGEQDDACRQILRSENALKLGAQSRIRILDRYISEHEQETLYAAADAVWLVYQGYPSMSGVLLQAAMRGIPVLSQSAGVMGDLVRDHELGLVADHRDPAQIRRQLHTLRDQAWDRAALRARAERAFAEHTPQAFARRVADVIAPPAGPGKAL